MYYFVYMYAYGIRTGEEITITPRNILTFKASQVLKVRINQEG
jgi:nucleoid DNA-binding protein